MKHLKVALVAISFAVAGAAYAQNGGGGGAGTPSPTMVAMQAACKADIDKLCAGKQGREMGQCLTQNAAALSKPCTDARAKLAAERAAAGGGAPRPN
jgi:hypothetical protein